MQGKGNEGRVDEDIIESDVELDNSDVVEPDNDPPQKVGGQMKVEVMVSFMFHSLTSPPLCWQMGDPSVETTEENRDAAQLLKSKAMDALFEGMS